MKKSTRKTITQRAGAKPKWRKNLDKAIRISSDLTNIAVQLQGKPSMLSVAALGIRAFDSINKLRENTVDGGPFLGWVDLENPIPSTLGLSLTRRNMMVPITTLDGAKDRGYVTCELGGITFGWEDRGSWYSGPCIADEADIPRANQLLARFVWETYGRNIVISVKDGNIEITADNLVESLPSQTSKKVTQRVLKFLEAGCTRAVLLYGEPGTGKSYIMREVGKSVGGLTLRMTSELLGEVNPDELIAFLAPSAVFIDDFERISNAGSVLKNFEHLRATTRLLMITVNDINALDRAVLRPGRIDDIIEVVSLDDDVVDVLLEGLEGEYKERMRKLPVAYLSHFNKTREVLGIAEAVAEVEELANRMEHIKGMGASPQQKYATANEGSKHATVSSIMMADSDPVDSVKTAYTYHDRSHLLHDPACVSDWERQGE